MEYKIIGGDGREYGTTNLEELKAWVRDGRISRNTLIWRSDSQTWMAAHNFGELDFELRELYARNPELQHHIFDPVGFWPRLGAYIVDAIILWVMFYFIWGIVGPMTGIKEPPARTITNAEEFIAFIDTLRPFLLWQMAVFYPMQMVYEVIFNGRFGATLGKMAIGAQVVRADGARLGYGTAFLRWMAERVSEWICYIGYIVVAFRDDKRGLHDLLAGTRVIYRR